MIYIIVIYHYIDMSVFDKVYVKTLLSSVQLLLDNLKLDGNTISSTDANGNINIIPDGTGEVLLNANPSSNLGASTKQYTDTKATINDASSSSTTETWSIDKITTEIPNITPYDLVIVGSDETTSIASTGEVVSIRAPREFSLTKIKVSVTTSGGSGFSVLVKNNGTTLQTIAQGTNLITNTSDTTTFTEDDIITIVIGNVGTSTATGLKVYLIGNS
jgi:hypothetical protein